MPYTNVPDADQEKMDSCVKKVMAEDGKDKEAAISICYASVVGKSHTPALPRDFLKELQDGIMDGITALFAKYGARHSKADNDAIQAVHDNAVQLGAMCMKARAYGSALTVFKEGDGWRWLGVVSNAYRDLDGENITSTAHREYVAHLDANPHEAPELWSWHTPGTARKARADWWDYTDNGFLWMSGPLTEAEAAQMQTGEPLGMSHGFKAVKQGNDIVYYRTFEVSELPIIAAANPWTKIQTLQTEDKAMGFTPVKRAFLETRFGADRVKELEDAEGAQAKALTAAGVTFKATDEMPAEDAPPPAPPAPEAKQEPPAAEGEAMDTTKLLGEIGAALATLQAQVAALMEAMQPAQVEMESARKARETLAANITAITERLTALEKSDDEKIAKALNPRIAPAATSATAQGVTGTKAAEEVLALAQQLSNNQFDWLKTVKIV